MPSRPTTTITIAGRSYTARAPKVTVWFDALRMVEAQQIGHKALARLEAERETLSDAEQQELLEAANVSPSMDQLQAALISGSVDFASGRLKGGLLRRSLSAEEYAELEALLDDDDSDVDITDLYDGATQIREAFTQWFEERCSGMGLGVPKV